MKYDTLFQSPALKTLIRDYAAGEVIFSEGSSANTVLLILSGSLQLTRKVNGQTSILATLGAGEFIGEKALLQESTFQRAATATAMTQINVLELGPKEFEKLEGDSPQLYSLLLKKAFKTLVERHERAESMNEVLREYEPQKRFLLYMHFLSEKAEQRPHGKMIPMNSETAAQHLNLTKETIDAWVRNLIDMKVITKDKSGFLSVPDEHAFLTLDPSHLDLSKAA